MNKKIQSWSRVALISVVLVLGGCHGTQTIQPTPPQSRQFNLISVNDIYNVEGIDARRAGGMSRLRRLRQQMSNPDEQVLLLHAGDFLFPSSMSSQYQGRQMIDLMDLLDGSAQDFDPKMFVVFGNHEFDKGRMKDAPMLAKRIEESDFHWLATNIEFSPQATLDSAGYQQSLRKNAITTINGIKVGIYGLTTNIAQPEYATIDDDYVAVSKRNIADLKARGAEVIIALTHLRMSEDKALLEQLADDGPDVVFGGHEHNRQSVCIGKRCVIKADADLRSAVMATVTVAEDGEVAVKFHFTILDQTTIDKDPLVEQRTNDWMARYQQEYCRKHGQGEGCLMEVIGKTEVNLVAEELEIRRFETNLGAYLADQMISAFDNIALPGGRKVQASLINSGSLRLNQNIPAHTELNQWYLNAIFQYPVDIRVLEISGKTLKAALDHSIESWTGNGWWLQVSGIAFIHDVQNQRVTDLNLIGADGQLTPVGDNDKIVVAVNSYMADPSIADQDGYTMFSLDDELVYGEQLLGLKSLFTESIKAQWAKGKGIAPQLPGRICNTSKKTRPCLISSFN